MPKKSPAAPKSAHAVKLENVFRLLKTIGHAPLYGSLWWVRENVWKSHIAGYGKNSRREGHPGLSTLRSDAFSPYHAVPMLHGRTGTNGPVVVTGLSRNDESHATVFGRIRPAGLGIDLFCGPGIRRNTYKPCLAHEEKSRLDAWLLEKGLA